MVKQQIYYELYDFDYLDCNAIYDSLKLLQNNNSIYDTYYLRYLVNKVEHNRNVLKIIEHK